MSTDVHEADEQQREAWRRGAEGWARRQASLREKTAAVSEWMVDAIAPRAGERVIEIAAGGGETGFLLAQQLGEAGSLLCTDQAPEMLELARRRAAEVGLSNVEFAVIDAQQLDLEPHSFDAAVCRWGYMLMADPDEAMRRTRRVLGAGGRLALATWDRPDRNLWMVAPMVGLVSGGHMPPPNPSEPGPFALADPEDLERRLEEAGFTSVRTDRVEFVQTAASFEEYWAEFIDMAAPLAAVVSRLAPAAVELVQASARGVLSQFIGEDGALGVPASAVVALAVA